ncbi:MAG: helix-turn-helix domain-containing protein [Spirochaetaceae bacterium]|jgi:cytoskeletal protein RodZ|nr:helix-turn-helix domain-containing protein [Spirochaetaceae bacterium]
MDALGDKLRSAREEKGYTFEQVSRETNIAARYLEALETEDFDKFPGEAYLLGFLRNYGEYLGLDAEDLLSNYRAIRIQEQPVPVEQLLRPPSPVPKIIRNVGIIVLAAAALGGAIYFFQNRRAGPGAASAPGPREPQSVDMDGPSLERRFYRGDTVTIPLNSNFYKIEVSDVGNTVSLAAPSGTQSLELGQEAEIDLDMDGFADLRVSTVDFSRNNPAAGALLRLDLDFAPAVSAAPAPAVLPGAAAGSAPASGPGAAASPAAAAQVIFTSPNAYPFTLQVNFQGFCMFRWEVLAERDRRGRNERYFSRSDELSIQAQNGVRIWLSNAQALRVQVIGGGRTVPLEIGEAGEVVVADVRWVRDEDGRFRLLLSRLE